MIQHFIHLCMGKVYFISTISLRGLLDETGSFLNWSIVKEKFSLRIEDYMNWMSVIQSIPTSL